MKKPSFHEGVLYMLLSATGLALTGFFAQFILQEMTLYAVVFWRYLASFIFCFVLLLCLGKLEGFFRFGNFKMHLLRAFFVLTAQYSFYFFLEKATLFNALVLLNTGPLFIPLIEKFLFKRKVSHSTWVSVSVSLIGVICVLQPDRDILSMVSLVGLLSGISQAASQVVFGMNSKTERTDLSILYLFFICTLVALFPYAISHHTWIHSEVKFANWLILGLGVASLCNQMARALAYQHGTPSGLAPFLYFAILLGALSDWIFFHITPNALSIVGAVLVVLGGVLKIYLRHRAIQK